MEDVTMQITVLYGGPSAEREVSLISGQAVIDGLREMGHGVFPSDVSPADLTGLDHQADVIFPVLHGAFGESGELQEILEQRGLPFVGSGSGASRLGMSKTDTKIAWRRFGLPTPVWEVITRSDCETTLACPCVVKPIDSGSSIDVAICRSDEQIDAACDLILARHAEAMVEQFIDGPELTVGLLEEQPLDPIRIVTEHEFFDYDAKYTPGATDEICPAPLDDETTRALQRLAVRVHDAFGCRSLSRTDVILPADGGPPVFLEVNTLPGLTSVSLFPRAALASGLSYAALCRTLVEGVIDRGRAPRGAPDAR
jgi:D-alanine-D-alanine ligase